MHSFTFNGHSSTEFGIRIERLPDLNRSERKYKSESVPGRNGKIYQLQNAWEEVEVSYDIFAGGPNDGDVVASFSDIMEWLNSADGYAELTDSYDPEHYRQAVFVNGTSISSQWHTWGKATITFSCRPERYIVETPISVANGSGVNVANNTNHIAHPVITLNGDGTRSLMDLTSRTVLNPDLHLVTGAFQLNQLIQELGNSKVYWFREYASFPDGKHIEYTGSTNIGGTVSAITNSTGVFQFTPSGDFGVGLIVPVDPSADYSLSFTKSTHATRVDIWLAEKSGYNNIIKKISSTSSFSFRTPANCGYALIVFYGDASNQATFTGVMLNEGTTMEPFKAYASAVTNTLTVKNISLRFNSSGFREAVVDCERENFSVNGVDKNNISKILDQYGNQSVDYLRLEEGNNNVTFSGSITSATIDRRLWQL